MAWWQPADNPTYTSYYLFNMTNYNDVITAGAKPNYTEVGPYVYQFTRTRYVAACGCVNG